MEEEHYTTKTGVFYMRENLGLVLKEDLESNLGKVHTMVISPGKGVIEYNDGYTYEGNFKDDEKNRVGYEVNYKEKTVQEFTYKDGSVENIGEELVFNKRTQKKNISGAD